MLTFFAREVNAFSFLGSGWIMPMSTLMFAFLLGDE